MDALEDLFFFFFSLTQDEKKEGGEKKKYKTQTEQRVFDIAAFP